MRIETTIKNGLPVTASATIAPPEPDVAIPGPYVADDLEIRYLSGHVCNLLLSEAEEQRICDEILEASGEQPLSAVDKYLRASRGQ